MIGLHIIAVIAWMAGLLYLPRLFAYHHRATAGGEMDQTFRTMEAKVMKIILNPAAILVWILGLTLILVRRHPATVGVGLPADALDADQAGGGSFPHLVASLSDGGAESASRPASCSGPCGSGA
ncbi:MAG: CopD family protein [Caulobacteraceae bacterium]